MLKFFYGNSYRRKILYFQLSIILVLMFVILGRPLTYQGEVELIPIEYTALSSPIEHPLSKSYNKNVLMDAFIIETKKTEKRRQLFKDFLNKNKNICKEELINFSPDRNTMVYLKDDRTGISINRRLIVKTEGACFDFIYKYMLDFIHGMNLSAFSQIMENEEIYRKDNLTTLNNKYENRSLMISKYIHQRVDILNKFLNRKDSFWSDIKDSNVDTVKINIINESASSSDAFDFSPSFLKNLSHRPKSMVDARMELAFYASKPDLEMVDPSLVRLSAKIESYKWPLNFQYKPVVKIDRIDEPEIKMIRFYWAVVIMVIIIIIDLLWYFNALINEE